MLWIVSASSLISYICPFSFVPLIAPYLLFFLHFDHLRSQVTKRKRTNTDSGEYLFYTRNTSSDRVLCFLFCLVRSSHDCLLYPRLLRSVKNKCCYWSRPPPPRAKKKDFIEPVLRVVFRSVPFNLRQLLDEAANRKSNKHHPRNVKRPCFRADP